MAHNPKTEALAHLDRLNTCIRFAGMDIESLTKGVAADPELALNHISAMLPSLVSLLKSAKGYADNALGEARKGTEAERAAFRNAHRDEPGFVAEAAE